MTMAVECSAALPDDRDDDHADEYFGDAERRPHALDRSDEKLGEQRHKRGRDEENNDGFSS